MNNYTLLQISCDIFDADSQFMINENCERDYEITIYRLIPRMEFHAKRATAGLLKCSCQQRAVRRGVDGPHIPAHLTVAGMRAQGQFIRRIGVDWYTQIIFI